MKKKKIYGANIKEQLKASAKDRLYSFLLAQGEVRGVIIHGTRMVNEMRANHELGILETLTLGHAYIGCGLLSASLKGLDRISLQINCSGPIKGLVAETNAFNEVRGFLKNVPIPVEKPLESYDLSPFFGAGFLTITKHMEDQKHPFSGQVALEYGSIAKDLANYYMTSEQIPTAFNLSIQFDPEGNVIGAGGLFLQVMPDAREKTIDDLDNLARRFPSIGAAYAKGQSPEDLVNKAFQKYAPQFLKSRRIEFLCHCIRERMQSFLSALPRADIKDIVDNGPFPVEIRCHHCNTIYHFTRPEIQKIYEQNLSSNSQ